MPLRRTNPNPYIRPRPTPQRRQSSYSRYLISPYPSTSSPSSSSSDPCCGTHFHPASRSRCFPSSSTPRPKSALRSCCGKCFTMAIRFCKPKKPEENSPKRQRSRLQRVSGPRKIDPPTGLRVNPLLNPGEEGFKNGFEGAVRCGAPVHDFSVRQDLVPIEPMEELRPMSLSFLNARDPGAASIQGVCGVYDAMTSPQRPESQTTSIHSADDRSGMLPSYPPPPTREAPPPPRDIAACGRNELPRSLAIVFPEGLRTGLASHPAVRNVHVSDRNSQFEQSAPCSGELVPTVIPDRDSVAHADEDNPALACIPILDPHAFELFQEYQRTGEIRYCIPESALDGNNKYTWQHCWSLINAYIYGFTVSDVDFADRVMDILDQQIAQRVCADSDTIRHVFTAYSVPEQLKRFVVDRSVNAGANNFRREHTRRLPKSYVLMVLEAAMDRISSGSGSHSSSSTGCEYHLHGKSRRCYKLIDARRKQEINGMNQRAAKGKRKGMKTPTVKKRERRSAARIGTAEAVRLIKVNGKNADKASSNSTLNSFKTVEKIEIRTKNSAARKDESMQASKRGYGHTSNESSGLEDGLSQFGTFNDTQGICITVDAMTNGKAKSDDKTTPSDQAADASMASSTGGYISRREERTRVSTPELGSQRSSAASLYTTPESTLDSTSSREFLPSTSDLVPARSVVMQPMTPRRLPSRMSMCQASAPPGSYPQSQMAV